MKRRRETPYDQWQRLNYKCNESKCCEWTLLQICEALLHCSTAINPPVILHRSISLFAKCFV